MKLDKNKNNSFLSLVVGSLLLPLCVNAVQIDSADYERTFNVRFSGYKGGSALTDFPALIRLSAALNEFDYSKCAGGANLRFADADGNLIPHEIDTWDPSGTSLVWVKVPSLANGTVIKVYYGYIGSGTQPAVTASDVWSNGYVGVWHMGAAAGIYTQTDSTANALALTCANYEHEGVTSYSGVAVGTEGVVGKAVAFDRNEKHYGAFYYRDYAPHKLAGLGAFTIEAWSRYDDSASANTQETPIVVRNSNNNGDLYKLYKATSANSGKHAFFFKMDGKTALNWISVGNAPAADFTKWCYSARCWDGATGNSRGYDNDVLFSDGTSDGDKGTLVADDGYLIIGNSGINRWGTNAFPGTIDEVRVSSVARSDDWVRASYDTVHDMGFAVSEKPNDWTKYSHKFNITFNPSDGSSVLSGFPVLVKIAEYDANSGTGIQGFDYDDFRKENGGDLHFADANGNMLPCEIETWNPEGESQVWVKVPSLTSGTKITAYYGCLFAPGHDSVGVWDENYLGVWHMNAAEGGLNQYDSTAFGKHVTCPSAFSDSVKSGVEGKVGKAAGFGLRSDNRGGFSVSDEDDHFGGLEEITIEAWTCKHSDVGVPTDVNGTIVQEGRFTGTWAYLYSMYEEKATGKIGFCIYSKANTGGKWPVPPSPAPSLDAWHYQVRRWNGTLGMFAKTQDDATTTESAASPDKLNTTQGTLTIGNQHTVNSTAPFRGDIDEVRISKVARSDAWIKATYDTIANNATFTTYGAARANVKGLSIFVR